MVTTSFLSRRCAGVICLLLLLTGCSKKSEPCPDYPRLTPKVRMQDVTFHSASLNRDMQYRVILPSSIADQSKLPVVYLLHGGDGSYQGLVKLFGCSQVRRVGTNSCYARGRFFLLHQRCRSP